MAQGGAGFNILSNRVSFADTASLDAFSRLRVSNPTYLFDSQFTYDIQPLLFEPIVAQSGASVTHDATNRQAALAFSSTPTGGQAILQSYEWIRYQPGRGQLFLITFNMVETAPNVLKFAGIGDGNNGVAFELNGTTKQFTLYSNSSNGDETTAQTDWNIDKLDGTGPSGVTLDITKTQILVIDYQALYVGRVRIGFDIDGLIIFAHEFKHANITPYPYIQNASLPIRVGMTCTATSSTYMNFICCSAISEGGSPDSTGYPFSFSVTGTAGNNARAHILSLRPRTTFNAIANRSKFILEDLSIIVTGTNPVKWELVIGQNLAGTTTFTSINPTYSAFEYNTAAVPNDNPLIIFDSGFVVADNRSGESKNKKVKNRYPITLNAAGSARDLGTISLLATGIGGTSAIQASISWSEIR